MDKTEDNAGRTKSEVHKIERQQAAIKNDMTLTPKQEAARLREVERP